MIDRDWPKVAYGSWLIYCACIRIARPIWRVAYYLRKLGDKIERAGAHFEFAMHKRFSAACRAAIVAKEKAQL